MLNNSLNLIAGYVFDAKRFPWITMWEENRVRQNPPWNGTTRVRGIEFGTSPFPLGLEQAQRQKELFGTATFVTLAPGALLSSRYHIMANSLPESWKGVREVRNDGKEIIVVSESGDEVKCIVPA